MALADRHNKHKLLLLGKAKAGLQLIAGGVGGALLFTTCLGPFMFAIEGSK